MNHSRFAAVVGYGTTRTLMLFVGVVILNVIHLISAMRFSLLSLLLAISIWPPSERLSEIGGDSH
ncbi:MAG: hypothetical protein AAF423_14285 [Pseudomonadota bacterium]